MQRGTTDIDECLNMLQEEQLMDLPSEQPFAIHGNPASAKATMQRAKSTGAVKRQCEARKAATAHKKAEAQHTARRVETLGAAASTVESARTGASRLQQLRERIRSKEASANAGV